MKICKCGGHAINVDKSGLECDVCYWRNKLEKLEMKINENKKSIVEILDNSSTSSFDRSNNEIPVEEEAYMYGKIEAFKTVLGYIKEIKE